LSWGAQHAPQAPSVIWSAASGLAKRFLAPDIWPPDKRISIRWLQAVAARQAQPALIEPQSHPTVTYKQAQRVRKILKDRGRRSAKGVRCV
jgi:hypothetical protein